MIHWKIELENQKEELKKKEEELFHREEKLKQEKKAFENEKKPGQINPSFDSEGVGSKSFRGVSTIRGALDRLESPKQSDLQASGDVNFNH